MKTKLLTIGILATTLTVSALIEKTPLMPKDVREELSKLSGKMDYNQDVKPILSDKCFACHGPDKAKQKAGLRLDMSNAAYAPLPENPGKVAIAPGNLVKSEVFHRIVSKDPEYMMPVPSFHLNLTAKEKAILIRWIMEGAVYQPHWAFVKPSKKPIPVLDSVKGINPIDAFVRARLNKMGLFPSKEAEPALLLRRLSLDLTGLPASAAETEEFLKNPSQKAYEKQVDRLLASPHFGERMAADWLDIARYADSHGYTVDRLRDMSPYRDWVIHAFNSNKRYDRFVHEQLAGDLMPNPTKEMIIATAFNRNHQQNMEGGIVEEEFQTEYVIDRTNTLGDAFMAISLNCSRCHDHKYDPFSQKNYYEMYSFFNNVLEAGQISFNDDLPTPTLMLPTDKETSMMERMQKELEEKEKELAIAQKEVVASANIWMEQEMYKQVFTQPFPIWGLQAKYELDSTLVNVVKKEQKGEMKHESGISGDLPIYEKGRGGQYLALDGDVYLDLKETGVFRKSEPFTISLWAKFPKEFKEGVIFHKSNAERLYNFKGFNLSVKDNRFEITMAHTAPSNAIIKKSNVEVPRDKWVHLSMSYDGSSKAAGFDFYMDGTALQMDVVIDKLYKDIVFFQKPEPGLQIGGWWRGSGFKDGKVDDITVYGRRLLPFEISSLAGKFELASLGRKSFKDLTNSEKEMLSSFYISTQDKKVNGLDKALTNLRTAYADSTEKIRELMVMEEMKTPKKTFLLQRGQYDRPGMAVISSTPESIMPFPKELPKNRWGLAQWLTHKDHPLTARVAVNRFWQQFFGTGLVKTSEDFGNQGELPSHPELLDWLALEFMENDWDIKKMVKMIVMSATYRQDSYSSKASRELDPENRYLSRGPSSRLSAEMIRDNALFAAGLLNRKIGGLSIRPYQPEGVWEINGGNYVADSTDEVYRRSLYSIIKRSVPNPTLMLFDASLRSSCITRRQRTNTPVQALALMNDPSFIEASKVLGYRMSVENNEETAIGNCFQELCGRKITTSEMLLLKELLEREKRKFAAAPQKAKGWLETGLYKFPTGFSGIDVAAYAVVASTIMNSDSFITKR